MLVAECFFTADCQSVENRFIRADLEEIFQHAHIERFAETAEKLAVKARRAAERRREAEAHEKNVRTGKKRPAKKAAEAGEAEPKRTEKRPALRTAAGAGGKRPTGAQSRGDAKKPSREERKRSAVKAAARARYADSRPVKRGKGSAKKEKQ